MIVRRDFLLQVLGLLTVASAPFATAADINPKRRRHAADPAPTPSPSPTEAPTAIKRSVALLRLWKANDAADRVMQIRLLFPGKPDSEAISPLKIEANNFQFSNYVEVPAERMIAEISATDRPTVLLPLKLSDGEQSTLLVRAQGTSLSAEWIDDTLVPIDNGSEFKIYNLLPTSGDIQVDLGAILTVHLSSIHSSLRLVGIKRGLYPIIINGIDGSGKTFHWNTEADFRQTRRATLLIYPDAYGRIRPRINNA